MNAILNPLDKYLHSATVKSSEQFAFHLAHPEVSYNDYCEDKQLSLCNYVSGKHVIYLDTNAWKCLSDYERKKAKLSNSMLDFCRAMNSDKVLRNCIFPIGVVTVFELQSMDDPASISTLADLVDRFSHGTAFRPINEVVEQELALFTQASARDVDTAPERFCHPMEMMGRLIIKIPDSLPAPATLAFKKATLDIVHSLPISSHLEIAASLNLSRWDNSQGIADMNIDMEAHKGSIKTYPDALFAELAGVLGSHMPDGPLVRGFTPAKAAALMAMGYWKEHPSSKQLISARIQASLNATIRYLQNRRFHNGDVSDILTAAVALPTTRAFFTDKRLVNLLNESTIGLKKYCSCDVISGFDNFAAYLKAVV